MHHVYSSIRLLLWLGQRLKYAMPVSALAGFVLFGNL
jgi:hypothetical protein